MVLTTIVGKHTSDQHGNTTWMTDPMARRREEVPALLPGPGNGAGASFQKKKK